MDRTLALEAFSRDVLHRFSDQTVNHLIGRSPVTFTASLTAAYLRENVEKEARKDRLIIEHAATAFDAGRLVTIADVDALFERTKDVDRIFIRQLVLPSVCIAIRYDDIADTRKHRILFLARFVEDLLISWQPHDTLPEAIKRRHTAGHFEKFLQEYLGLYCQEMKELSNSVKFLPPFNRAMDLFLEEIVETMEDARFTVARTITSRFYRVPELAAAKRTPLPDAAGQ